MNFICMLESAEKCKVKGVYMNFICMLESAEEEEVFLPGGGFTKKLYEAW